MAKLSKKEKEKEGFRGAWEEIERLTKLYDFFSALQLNLLYPLRLRDMDLKKMKEIIEQAEATGAKTIREVCNTLYRARLEIVTGLLKPEAKAEADRELKKWAEERGYTKKKGVD